MKSLSSLARVLTFVLAFVGVLGSYQPVFAEDNGFSLHRVQNGDSVTSLLRHYGFSGNARDYFFRSAAGLEAFSLTTEMNYLVKVEHGTTTLRIFDAQSDRGYSLWHRGTDAGFGASDLRIESARVEGTVHGSLTGSLLTKVRSNWIASRFIDAYILNHDLRHLEPGAHFTMAVERKYSGTQFIRYGEVLATSLEIGGQTVRKDFKKLPHGGVFISTGDLVSEKPFYSPVDYVRVASLFQPDRLHPITHRVQPHLGIDFEMAEGQPVYAPRKGEVLRWGHSRAAGNYLVLGHTNGMETVYDHLRRIPAGLHVGKTVESGQKIAEVGCTGYCTKAHLHFGVRVNGRMVNPARYLKSFPQHLVVGPGALASADEIPGTPTGRETLIF